MTPEKEDELMINVAVIANDSKWIRDWAMNHEKLDATNASELKGIAKAAHARIDKADERINKTNDRFNWLTISGVMALIILTLTLLLKK